MKGVGRAGRRPAAAVLLAVALVTPLFAGAGAVADERTGGAEAGSASRPTQKESDAGPDPLDFAVVVDQSDSLSKDDLKREVEAAALISQGEISEDSRAMVMGFGSAEKEGQSAVDEVCELTRADGLGRQELSDCVQKLNHPDRKKTGSGTDFPAALSQAADRLTEDDEPGRPKVVFLLTDGRLDVRDSSNYGKEDDPEARQRNGEDELRDELARARDEHIQIWPLGFGDVDEKALDDMAAGGYRGACAELPDAKPRKRVLKDSENVEKELQKIFADARCASVEPGTEGTPPASLHVTIPAIATDGSITVTKRDPQVRATYSDPKGREVPTSGEKFGSRFELSGQDGPVEALRVTNPLPGRWTVRLEAPEGHRDKKASVSAIWQGRLRSAVTLDPTSPKPGETARIKAVLQTREDVVVDDSHELGGVHATATVRGEGFEPVRVRLRDGGKDGDSKAGDAHFSGDVEIPDTATGALSVTSEMAAPGVTGDERPYNTRVTKGAAPLRAHAQIGGYTVHPGGTVKGTLEAHNDSGSPHTLRLRLAGRTDTSVRIVPSSAEVPAGQKKTLRYRLHFGAGTPLGEAGGRVQVVDETDGGRVLDDMPLAVTVTPTPTWWDEHWPKVAAGAVVAALAGGVVFALRRLGKRRRDLGEVELHLSGGRSGSDPVKLPIRGGLVAWFIVERGSEHPRLRKCGSGTAGAYRLTRDGAAGATLTVRPPRGAGHLQGGAVLNLGDGLRLSATARRRGERDRRPQSLTVVNRPDRNPLTFLKSLVPQSRSTRSDASRSGPAARGATSSDSSSTGTGTGASSRRATKSSLTDF